MELCKVLVLWRRPEKTQHSVQSQPGSGQHNNSKREMVVFSWIMNQTFLYGGPGAVSGWLDPTYKWMTENLACQVGHQYCNYYLNQNLLKNDWNWACKCGAQWTRQRTEVNVNVKVNTEINVIRDLAPYNSLACVCPYIVNFKMVGTIFFAFKFLVSRFPIHG